MSTTSHDLTNISIKDQKIDVYLKDKPYFKTLRIPIFNQPLEFDASKIKLIKEKGGYSQDPVYEAILQVENLPAEFKLAVKQINLPSYRKKPGRLKPENENKWKKLVKEVETMEKLKDSPFVVTFYGCGIAQDQFWICMELMDESLRKFVDRVRDAGWSWLSDEGVMSLNHIARCIINGLALCSKENIQHCDIKPDNVLVNHNGDVKLCDFGEANSGFGTLGYGAPETYQARLPKKLDHQKIKKADIWSIGIMLAELITGENPIEKLCRKKIAGLNISSFISSDSLMSDNQIFYPVLQDLLTKAFDIDKIKRKLVEMSGSKINVNESIYGILIDLVKNPNDRPSIEELAKKLSLSPEPSQDLHKEMFRNMMEDKFFHDRNNGNGVLKFPGHDKTYRITKEDFKELSKYKLRHKDSGKMVSLKPQKRSFNMSSFKTELEFFKAFESHPYISQFYGWTLYKGIIVFCEEIYDITWDKMCKKLHFKGFLKFPEKALTYFALVLTKTLSDIHASNYMLGNMRPYDIRLTRTGDIKLANFKLIKKIDEIPKDEKNDKFYEYIVKVFNYIHYIAPEMMLNPYGHNQSNDIWSLGCTLVETATLIHNTGAPHTHAANGKILQNAKLGFVQRNEAFKVWLDLGYSLDEKERQQSIVSCEKEFEAIKNDAAIFLCEKDYSDELCEFVTACFNDVESRPTIAALQEFQFYRNFDEKILKGKQELTLLLHEISDEIDKESQDNNIFQLLQKLENFELNESPCQNIATLANEARVITGRGFTPKHGGVYIDPTQVLFNGNLTIDEYVAHDLGVEPPITIQLNEVYLLDSMKFLLWNGDERAYSYYIEVSKDNTIWNRIGQYENQKGWQLIEFKQQAIRYIRLVGTHCTHPKYNQWFHLIHFECPAEDILNFSA